MAAQAMPDPCQESLSLLGHAIKSEPLFSIKKKSEMHPLSSTDLLDKGEHFNQLIRDVQEQCQDFRMSRIPEAALFAFGDNLSNKCMRQFVPFFTNLFNPENHKFEEKREASQSLFSKVAHKAKHTVKHTTKSAKHLSKHAIHDTTKLSKHALHDATKLSG